MKWYIYFKMDDGRFSCPRYVRKRTSYSSYQAARHNMSYMASDRKPFTLPFRIMERWDRIPPS